MNSRFIGYTASRNFTFGVYGNLSLPDHGAIKVGKLSSFYNNYLSHRVKNSFPWIIIRIIPVLLVGRGRRPGK